MLCYKIHRIILIQNPYIFLLPSPSILPVSLPPSPSSLRALLALAQDASLHFPWLDGGSWGPGCPVCLHTPQYITHTLRSQLAARLALPCVCAMASSTHRRWGLQGGEAPGWGGSGGGRFGSDNQMLPINFSGHHRAVRGESGTCTI